MGSKWPSRTECWQRLRAADPPAWVLDHVLAVEGLSVEMARAAVANGSTVDIDLVQSSAILHDIGRSITQDPTHAYRGAELLRSEAWPPEIVAIVERHTGAGLTLQDATKLGLPRAMIPSTLEEQIVAHADNLLSGTKRLGLAQLEAKYNAKGLTDACGRIVQLHHQLTEHLGVDPASLEGIDLAAP